MLSLALSITSVASIAIDNGLVPLRSIHFGGGVLPPVERPTGCRLVTVPKNSPAQNYPAYCDCINSGSPAYYPTTSLHPSATVVPGSIPDCPYVASELATMPTITPAPLRCDHTIPEGFWVPIDWCECSFAAGQTTNTYSTKPFNPPCSFNQVDGRITVTPTSKICSITTAPVGAPFYDELAWCACGSTAYPTASTIDLFEACNYATKPSATLSLSRVPSISCTPMPGFQVQPDVTPPEQCGCGPVVNGKHLVAYETQTTGPALCVFTTVPPGPTVPV